MTAKQKGIEYLDRLIKELEKIEKMESPSAQFQAKLELRNLFEECYIEGVREGRYIGSTMSGNAPQQVLTR